MVCPQHSPVVFSGTHVSLCLSHGVFLKFGYDGRARGSWLVARGYQSTKDNEEGRWWRRPREDIRNRSAMFRDRILKSETCVGKRKRSLQEPASHAPFLGFASNLGQPSVTRGLEVETALHGTCLGYLDKSCKSIMGPVRRALLPGQLANRTRPRSAVGFHQKIKKADSELRRPVGARWHPPIRSQIPRNLSKERHHGRSPTNSLATRNYVERP